MWKKRNVASMDELMQSRPGATYELHDYRQMSPRDLPEIINLRSIAESLTNSLLDNRIVLVCDYDTDGIMSGGIMLKALNFLAAEAARVQGGTASDISLIVPDRFRDGYGFQPHHAEEIRPGSIIILLANGISQHDAIRAARENGSAVYVVDHHLPGSSLPDADRIINPWVFPGKFQEYCAAGLCYRLVREMLDADWVRDNVAPELVQAARDEFLFMAAVATVADIVPILNENRIIVREGLRYIPSFWKKAVCCLCDEDKDFLTEEDVSFRVSPAVNSVGRLGKLNSEWIQEFFLDGAERRAELAKELYTLNEERKRLTAQAQDAAEEILRSDPEPDAPAFIVQSECFHPGIVGIVAGRLSDARSRPVFVFGPEANGELTGSGRSKDNPVNLRELLDYVNASTDAILRYGGHRSAAGVTIRADRLDAFIQAAKEYAFSLEDAYEQPDQYYDFILDEKDDWFRVYQDIRRYAPFGEGNPEPVFMCRFTPVPGYCKVMGRDHFKVRNLADQDAVGFGLLPKYREVEKSSAFRFYGSLTPNRYCGGLYIQFLVRDLESADDPPAENRTQTRLQSLMDAI